MQSFDAVNSNRWQLGVELGATIAPKQDHNAPFLVISLKGFAGKCKGIAGNVQSTWTF